MNGITVSDDRTHHLAGGVPLYAARFDEVLSFHPPGLAAVRLGGEAWHIGLDGRPAYDRRFLRAFGIYEERAAVATSTGWCHIRPDGSEIYSERWAWCGNFQEGRVPVRDAGGGYHHLDLEGRQVGAGPWCYAGDYRDGVAVVQAADGQSTHLDLDGRLLHGKWFRDLDVFHKGLARARDAQGWTHVDRRGQPAYARRFAMVEPFYNGQARVERPDGALEVIDEAGETLVELRPALRSEFAALSAEMVGYWRTGVIGAAAEIGVFRLLPASSAQIASGTGLPVPAVRRLLRGLGELGLVASDQDLWTATRRGIYLDPQHPLSLHSAAIEYARHMIGTWRDLPAILREGRSREPDLFRVVAEDDSRTDGFHSMLAAYAAHDYQGLASAIEVPADSTLVDAGGGTGVVAELLLEAKPRLRVVLLERPEVLARSSVPEALRSGFQAVAGDIFAPWPVSGDAVLLARVLHDWDDQRCGLILRHARVALAPGGLLFVAERLGDPGQFGGSLCDLHLLANTGGAERSLAEYEGLLADAGFELQGWAQLETGPSVLRAVAR